jgi:hypothetical protein
MVERLKMAPARAYPHVRQVPGAARENRDERADACFDRTGRICKLGETPASIEAFYRRQGPTVWLNYQKGLYYLTLANQYDQAANRPSLPMLFELPPIGRVRDIRTLAPWGLEALLEATPAFGIFLLVLTLRAATAKVAIRSAACHDQSMIQVLREPSNLNDGFQIVHGP